MPASSPSQEASIQERFAKIKPPMHPQEAVIEASRCLFCYDAPCTQACPSSIDIPMFIRQIMSHNPKGAAKTILSQNILGRSCAYVCPTEVLCEGACVYHDINDKPIDIGRLQGYATDLALADNVRFFNAGASLGKKVAVVGGGPAGLACAHELTVLGYTVDVFEASPEAGGLNRYGVAPYKYSNREAQQEVAYVAEIGFHLHLKHRVLATEQEAIQRRAEDASAEDASYVYHSLEALEKDYDAIFMAVGLGASRRLLLSGEHLPGVYGAAEFIHDLRARDLLIEKAERVVVVGAGNTAIDAAVESAKLGAEVTLVYRRTEAEQRAYWFEVELAKCHGVQFRYLTTPVEILGQSRLEGVRCVRNTPEQTLLPETAFTLPCDRLILATGQEKQQALYQSRGAFQFDQSGKIVVNAHYQTSNPQYFAGGDCVNGGKEVVNAVAHGRDAARGIHHVLMERGS